MFITDIEEINIGYSKRKTAYKIYIDDVFAFLLYYQDIKKYKLSKGMEISSSLYDEVIEDTVFRRAKQKALAILKYMDRTEKELYTKLQDAYYNYDIIVRTIDYLKDYNYIDDERYASNYIRSKKTSYSKLYLKTKLIKKGINKEVLEKVIDIEYNSPTESIDPEILAINKGIEKRYTDTASLVWEDKQKLISSLYRKGFNLDKIIKCIGDK